MNPVRSIEGCAVPLAKSVAGYQVHRTFARAYITVTIYWHDLLGFSGIAPTLPQAVLRAHVSRADFLRAESVRLAETKDAPSHVDKARKASAEADAVRLALGLEFEAAGATP